MKTPLFLGLTLASLTLAAPLGAATIELNIGQMGYSWWQRSTWMGGSDTTEGFSYGDATGLQHVQNNYQYYGGADRYLERKNLYFQIDLGGLPPALDGTAIFNFYVTRNSSPVPTNLLHLADQTLAPTGDAADEIAGDTIVASTGGFSVGWNSIDLTAYIQSDLAKGHEFAAFSIPQFGQVQDQNRLLSIYGPGSTEEIGGEPTRPYLEVTLIPEPSALWMSLIGCGICGLTLFSRRAARR